jgi:hypothetical protein
MNSNLAKSISLTSSQEQEENRILETIVNYKCRNCYCEYYTSSVKKIFFHALHVKTLNQSESQVLFRLMERYPHLVKRRGKQNNLPIHIVLLCFYSKSRSNTIFTIINMYPMAVKEKDNKNRLPLQLALSL